MSSESVRPVHVSSRSVGGLVIDIGILISAASLLGVAFYLSYKAELSTDPTALYVFFTFLMAAAVLGIRGNLKTRTIEFYGDHLKVVGYKHDGKDSMDAPYSEVDIKGRSGASVFLLSINAVSRLSFKVANKGVQTSAGTVPLLAWIKEKKKGSATALQ